MDVSGLELITSSKLKGTNNTISFMFTDLPEEMLVVLLYAI